MLLPAREEFRSPDTPLRFSPGMRALNRHPLSNSTFALGALRSGGSLHSLDLKRRWPSIQGASSGQRRVSFQIL
jgi:hypothetical protein